MVNTKALLISRSSFSSFDYFLGGWREGRKVSCLELQAEGLNEVGFSDLNIVAQEGRKMGLDVSHG